MSETGDELFEDGDEGDESEDGAPDKDPSTDGKDPKSTDKRVSDLQSKADKETARANKAESRLKALEAALKDDDAGVKKPVAETTGNVTDNVILDMARMFAFQMHPKLAEYGVTAADLGGGTPSEIAQIATELVSRYEKIETRVRNRVLADQGLAPEIDGGNVPSTPRDFSTMSKEDFQKVMDAALNKR